MANFNPPHHLPYGEHQGPIRDEVSRAIRQIPSDKGLLTALVGATAGGTAQVNQPRVQHPVDPKAEGGFGGLRPTEDYYRINRVTTATDVTELQAVVNKSMVDAYVPTK